MLYQTYKYSEAYTPNERRESLQGLYPFFSYGKARKRDSGSNLRSESSFQQYSEAYTPNERRESLSSCSASFPFGKEERRAVKGYIKNRLITYSKNIVPLGLKSGANTILYDTYVVNEDILDKTERILIKHFSNKFMKERGREWFKGDIKEMMYEIGLIIESILTTILKSYPEDMNEEKEICNYCNKIFVSKTSLMHHQKTAKFCLSKQGINNLDFKCSYCLKILSTYPRLNTHLSICKKKKDEENETKLKENETIIKECQIKLHEKEKYISKLEDLLKEANQTIYNIAKQPKTVQINTNNLSDDIY